MRTQRTRKGSSVRDRFFLIFDHLLLIRLFLIVDPDTNIAFPTTLVIPSKVRLPPYSLLGLGVRKVSFLGIKVYSVAFYADLSSPNLKVSFQLI